MREELRSKAITERARVNLSQSQRIQRGFINII